jgi:hypothetical protein
LVSAKVKVERDNSGWHVSGQDLTGRLRVTVNGGYSNHAVYREGPAGLPVDKIAASLVLRAAQSQEREEASEWHARRVKAAQAECRLLEGDFHLSPHSTVDYQLLGHDEVAYGVRLRGLTIDQARELLEFAKGVGFLWQGIEED